jgi:hypothetical protein
MPRGPGTYGTKVGRPKKKKTVPAYGGGGMHRAKKLQRKPSKKGVR